MYEKVLAHEFGGPEVLGVEQVADLPEPGQGEVRVRVEAAGVGFTDTIVRRGKYHAYKAGLPCTPGYDMVGTVDALGPGVSSLRVGQRVADMPVYGSYSQYLVRPARDVVPLPDSIDPAAAVEVPLMWMTAWQMLTRCVALSPGDHILVVGASGSMGRALLTLGAHLELRMIGTASKANLAQVEAAGATAIDYRSPDLAGAILEASGGQGVVAAFDAVGGASFRTSRAALAKGGTLVGYGFQDFVDNGGRNIAAIPDMLRLTFFWTLLGRLDRTGRRAMFYNIQTRRGKLPQEFTQDLTSLFGLIAAGQLTLPQPEILPLADAAEAHRRIAAGGLQRRLVLDPWASPRNSGELPPG